jgi:hypothetical protein
MIISDAGHSWLKTPNPQILPQRPDLPVELMGKLRSDFERFGRDGLPEDIEAHLVGVYQLDVTASYAGQSLRNPWGIASGQLSMQLPQVEEAIRAGLGFVVLKTVIAEDSAGQRTMDAWAVKESRMAVEPIVGRTSGKQGWTVSWKGRGWWQPFEAYLDLIRVAIVLGREQGVLVVPSVKYHLPAPGESTWRIEEYATTTKRLIDACLPGPIPIEKDFSPTLAGSERASQRAKILEWLAVVPGLMRQAAAPRRIHVGLKLFNALDEEAFQLEMLHAVHGPEGPDYLVYANRLFDPDREFAGQRGIAYGGPDLSDRNLRVLSALRAEQSATGSEAAAVEISATGNICSGRMAVEYLLRGCTSFQIHTFFQVPQDVYPGRSGGRLQRALHTLYFHPEEGLIVWLLWAARRLGLEDRPVRLLDLAALGSRSDFGHFDPQSA